MPPSAYWHGKVALITGGTAGLGLVLAETLAQQGARVAIIGRDAARLAAATERLNRHQKGVLPLSGDVTSPGFLSDCVQQTLKTWGQLDFACHCAGRSMRSDVLTTSRDDFEQLWRINTLAAVDLARATAPALVERRGHLVLVGSLASRVAPRYLGAYPASKFPVAALAQQLRLELGPAGLHTLLVMPGPLARDDGGARYDADNLPAAARRPGGGAKVRMIDPAELSARMLTACERRKHELIVPGKARLLFVVSQLSSRWGDWLLNKNMSK